MRYAYIDKNDVVNGEGVCVSLFVQGCPHRCPGCFNSETWEFNGGQIFTDETKWEIIKAISANGIERNFSILGGEPLAPQNKTEICKLINAVRMAYPNIIISIWTGYKFKDIYTVDIVDTLEKVDYIIDGQFIEEEKNLDLKWRGSNNQHIYYNPRKGDELGQWRLKDD